MNKKYLSLISLAALLVLIGGLLSGCGFKTSEEESIGLIDESAAPAEEAPLPNEPAAPPVMSDVELDQELKNIDDDLKAVETTGFESTNLADKDLGI